jgi:hypothetical protein
MVRIVAVNENKVEATGELFYSLTIVSNSEIAISQKGNPFLKQARVRISAGAISRDLSQCERMIGTELDGNIIRVECDEYDYVAPDGTEYKLTHQYKYVKEEQAEEQVN